MAINRRSLLAAALASASAALPAAQRATAAASQKTIRIPDVLPGNVGAIWRSLISGLGPDALGGLDLEWIGGNPGQTQNQFLAGALDVTFSGSVGTATL